MNSLRNLFIVIFAIGVLKMPNQSPSIMAFAYSEKSIYNDVLDVFKECGGKTLTLCFKEKVLTLVDHLPENFNLGTNIRIKRIADGTLQNSSSYVIDDIVKLTSTPPPEGGAREFAVDSALWRKLTAYVGSHSFEFRFPLDQLKANLDEEQQLAEEGRKKKGKKGHWWPMLMLLQLKAATIGALMLKVISFVAFKALLLGKIALTIATLVGLKHSSGHKHHVSTYEVVPHPHFEHYEDFGHHHDRSLVSSSAGFYDSTNPNNNHIKY